MSLLLGIVGQMEGKTNMFYVLGTVLVFLSMSLILNGTVSADTAKHLAETGSSLLSGIVLPGQQYPGGTLYDMYCLRHHDIFALRF